MNSDEVRKAMRKRNKQKEKEIDAAATAMVEAAKSDPNLNQSKVAKHIEARERVKAISKEEEERTMVREVKLKLKALRNMWCPTRKACQMWRKCLVRAQVKAKQNAANGILRTPSVKPAQSPSNKEQAAK